MIRLKTFSVWTGLLVLSLIFSQCSDSNDANDLSNDIRSSSASTSEQVEFSGSSSSEDGVVYEVLPGPAAMDPSMSPTPFSNEINTTQGSYSFEVSDLNESDSQDSEDAVDEIEIRFTGNDGTEYLIDQVDVIHKPEGAGHHTFFGGVGLNKMMHGDTGIGNSLMPKMMSYITFWGLTNLKNANTGEVVAENRLIHLMTTTRVRDSNLDLITSAEQDSSDHNYRKAETHVILPPEDMDGNESPVPGTDHGFLHMMFEEVNLEQSNRQWDLAYEILPGPAALNPEMAPTPFSNRVSLGAGEYSLSVLDVNDEDSPDSDDRVEDVTIQYQRANGTGFLIDNIDIIHKEDGSGDHTFFGGVGYDKQMHGNTGIGTNLMPQLNAEITLWGTADLKNLNGEVLDTGRLIHIMTGSRVRTDDLKLITAVETDESDHSRRETHIMLPPQDLEENPSPVDGTKHGFLHLMFENVTLN